MGIPEVPGYQNIEAVASGGHGTVFRARQERLDRIVALKMVSVEPSNDRARDASLRESRIMATVSQHPQIVTIHDTVFAADGSLCLVMEWYERGSLADEMAATGPLPVARVLDVGIKVAAGLKAAHDRGIIHRDLKPGNIMLSDYGEPAITDFGTASHRADHSEANEQHSFTLHYAAPELLDNGPVTPAADVYALAATLYHAVSGRRPFWSDPAPTPKELITRIVASAPSPLSDEVPQPLRELIYRNLAKDPSRRHPTARAVAEALQGIQGTLDIAATPIVSPSAAAAVAGLASDDPTDGTELPDVDDGLPAWIAPSAMPAAPRRWGQSQVRWLTDRYGPWPAVAALVAVLLAVAAVLPFRPTGRGPFLTADSSAAVDDAAGAGELVGDMVAADGPTNLDDVVAADASTDVDDLAPDGPISGAQPGDDGPSSSLPPGGGSDPDGSPGAADDSTRSVGVTDTTSSGGASGAPDATSTSSTTARDSSGPTTSSSTNTSAAPTSTPPTSPPTTSQGIDCSQWYTPARSEQLTPFGATTTADADVRRAPDSAAACARGVVLPAGANVTVHAERSGWRYTHDALTDDWGWVPSSAFAPTSTPSTEPQIDCSQWYTPARSEQVTPYAATTTADADVRRAPDSAAACARGVVLPAGAEIMVHAERGAWRYTYDPLTNDWGWIPASAL